MPSLEPAATAKLWKRLVAHPRRLRAATQCRPLRAVFYASTDWLRLATKLAATASPCAQYYISIPPLVSDKTKPRPDQAWRIRALGGNFHAMAENHFATWSKWVASTGSSWYAAGVEARRRMVEAGFDLGKGDTWALNEFPSTVRTGVGPDRLNARELVRGLYDGGGATPTRGTVFIVGVGQAIGNVSTYQTNVQNWLADSAFWTDMATYVSDWSQEVYPDVRRYAVPGAAITLRRDYLNDYLQHELVLAAVGPPTIQLARTYLQAAYSPLANAAWQWDTGYGWTTVPVDQMQAFVSAQTYGLRFFSATTGQSQDHWGFAWSPRNASGLTSADFAAQSGAVLDRLAAAIRDSGESGDASDPGGGACGPPGQNLFCGGELAGAQFTEVWKALRAWSQPVLAFTTPAQTLQAGTPSTAIGLSLISSSGAPQVAAGPITIAISSSSSRGQLSLGPAGPWSTTIVVTMPAGSNAASPFYYLDTRAGSPELTAVASGVTTATQVETVRAGPPAAVQIDPASATVPAARSRSFAVAAADAYGNPVALPAAWSVTPAGLGRVKPKVGLSTTFTARGRGGTGRLVATVTGATGPLSGSAAVTVGSGKMRVTSVRYAVGKGALLVMVKVVAGSGRPVGGALVSVVVRRDGSRAFAGRARTGVSGRATYRLFPRRGCYRTTVTRVAAAGYRWTVGTPRNRFCRK